MDLKPIVVWVAALIVTVAVALALHLPERMRCRGVGRSMTCERSLLSPELWAGH